MHNQKFCAFTYLQTLYTEQGPAGQTSSGPIEIRYPIERQPVDGALGQGQQQQADSARKKVSGWCRVASLNLVPPVCLHNATRRFANELRDLATAYEMKCARIHKHKLTHSFSIGHPAPCPFLVLFKNISIFYSVSYLLFKTKHALRLWLTSCLSIAIIVTDCLTTLSIVTGLTELNTDAFSAIAVAGQHWCARRSCGHKGKFALMLTVALTR